MHIRLQVMGIANKEVSKLLSFANSLHAESAHLALRAVQSTRTASASSPGSARRGISTISCGLHQWQYYLGVTVCHFIYHAAVLQALTSTLPMHLASPS